jgi:hypothetical protein
MDFRALMSHLLEWFHEGGVYPSQHCWRLTKAPLLRQEARQRQGLESTDSRLCAQLRQALQRQCEGLSHLRQKSQGRSQHATQRRSLLPQWRLQTTAQPQQPQTRRRCCRQETTRGCHDPTTTRGLLRLGLGLLQALELSTQLEGPARLCRGAVAAAGADAARRPAARDLCLQRLAPQ